MRKVVFLGVVIGSNEIEMEKEKVDRVLSWPELKNIKNIRKFLGLTNYCKRFIKDFAWVTRPMNCYNMAKQLSHYLYFFSFSFYLIRKSIDT